MKSGNQAIETASGVAAVERALRILAVFEDRDEPLTLAQVAQRSGFYKSTILRLIASLERFRYIRRLADGRYHVGPEPMRLAQLYQQSFRLSDAVMPVLRRLADECGVTASFYVREGDSRICLHRVEPARIVRISVHEGDRLPLDRGASGRVLRAFSGEKGELFDDIRKACFAASFGERDAHTAAIAAPVFGVGQAVRGVLNFSGLREVFTPRHVGELRRHILEAAAELTQSLGGDGSVFGVQAKTSIRLARRELQ